MSPWSYYYIRLRTVFVLNLEISTTAQMIQLMELIQLLSENDLRFEFDVREIIVTNPGETV